MNIPDQLQEFTILHMYDCSMQENYTLLLTAYKMLLNNILETLPPIEKNIKGSVDDMIRHIILRALLVL
jgi:hypothetical protein